MAKVLWSKEERAIAKKKGQFLVVIAVDGPIGKVISSGRIERGQCHKVLSFMTELVKSENRRENLRLSRG